MSITFIIKTFDQLSKQELYDCLQLRSEVFVVEQDCVYQDIDGKDAKALHVLGYIDTNLIAYSRVFDSGAYFDLPSIGRIVVKESHRNYNYGHELVEASIQYITENFEEKNILISAQKYLLKFYNSHGFIEQGEEYLEDGIPHVRMLRTS